MAKVSGQSGALLTDLSRDCIDCIDHELLIAKLYAYDFDKNSLYFINSYLKGRKQITEINSSHSAFAEMLFGVPQGSILAPLPFNIYICDLFFWKKSLTLILLIMWITIRRMPVIRPWFYHF